MSSSSTLRRTIPPHNNNRVNRRPRSPERNTITNNTKRQTTTTTTTTSTSTTTTTIKNNKHNNKNKHTSNTIRFDDGAVQFRYRLVLSLLSHCPILIRNIRSDALEPGLLPYEISFLRLLDRITNGSRIEINATGTQVRFVPGILIGGGGGGENDNNGGGGQHVLQHECPVGDGEEQQQQQQQEQILDNNKMKDSSSSITHVQYRSIGWFLEGILPLAPFGKQDLTITFTGITDGTCYQQEQQQEQQPYPEDPSVDYIKLSMLPFMTKQMGIVGNDLLGSSSSSSLLSGGGGGPTISILRRGGAPMGGGIVQFYCPLMKQIEKPIDWIELGKFKRIRGTATSCTLISSSSTARVAYTAKGLLQRLLPDVWIHTNVHTRKQDQCGPSPSLTIILTAISTSGVVLTTEGTIQRREIPEQLGQRVAVQLLQQIQYGGCIDSDLQSMALLFMCLGPEDVSRIRLGRLTPYTIQALRLYKQMLDVEFKIQTDEESKTILLSCVGIGYRNMARASS